MVSSASVSSSGSTVILVPVKNLSSAKQRLAAVLDQTARTELAQAMLYDVLTALHEWSNHPQVAVVSSDPYAAQLAAEYAFEVIPDPANPGETGAIEMATRVCVERGAGSTLVMRAPRSSQLPRVGARASCPTTTDSSPRSPSCR